MSYLGVGVSPGNVPVYHGSNIRVVERRIKIAELSLRCLIFGLSAAAALLVATDTQDKVIFSMHKTARFTSMKALVVLVAANGITAAYSVVQVVRCIVGMVRGRWVVASKPVACAILFGDQAIAYLMVAAVAAAVQSALFAKFGQTELQWMKICDMYGMFCKQVGEGIASALLVGICMVIMSCFSAFSLFRLYGGINKAKNNHPIW